jgi:hypothetical protein
MHYVALGSETKMIRRVQTLFITESGFGSFCAPYWNSIQNILTASLIFKKFLMLTLEIRFLGF